jgi:cytochrome c biogenesis protein CcdA
MMAAAHRSHSVTGMETQERSPLGLIVTVIVVAVAAVLGLSIVFWALGLVASIFGWLFRIALLAAVAAVVWHYVTRRLSRTRM